MRANTSRSNVFTREGAPHRSVPCVGTPIVKRSGRPTCCIAKKVGNMNADVCGYMSAHCPWLPRSNMACFVWSCRCDASSAIWLTTLFPNCIRIQMQTWQAKPLLTTGGCYKSGRALRGLGAPWWQPRCVGNAMRPNLPTVSLLSMVSRAVGRDMRTVVLTIPFNELHHTGLSPIRPDTGHVPNA